MRFILIFFLHVSLFASNYDFDEIKFVSAVETDFRQSGNLKILNDETIITYQEPRFKRIIKKDNNISIESSSGDIYHLKGKALYYTALFIDIMTKLDNFDEIKTNRDFSVEKEKNILYLTFLGDLADVIEKAEVKIKEKNILSFKLFMPNEDTLEVIKK